MIRIMRKGLTRGALLGPMALVLLLTGSTHTEAPVADAAMRGDAETVRLLLRQGEDVNAAQGDGMTALHWTARSGEASLAEMLVYAGANLESTTRVGAYTPLLVAARAGNEDVLVALVKHGANLEARTSTGVTALHFASAAGAEGAITALVEKGADVDVREMTAGQTPLMFAASSGRTGAVRLLTSLGADVALTTETVDLAEVEKEDQAEMRRRDARVSMLRNADSQGEEAAAEGEEAEEAGAPAAAAPAEGDSATPPVEAAVPPADSAAAPAEPGAPTADSAAAPAEPGVPPAEQPDEPQPGGGGGAQPRPEGPPRNPDEPQPLSYTDLVGGHGGMTALLHAVRQGHAETALALVDAGADVNDVTGGDGASAMLVATINGHFDLALALMARGADPNVASNAGTTPLYAAINAQWAPKALYPQPQAHERQQTGYLDFMRAVLEGGADPNVRLEKHLWFMSYNFDLLGVDTAGSTPFWRAAYALDIPAMRLLLEFDADPGIPSRKQPERRRRGGEEEDPSGLAPIPVGGPGVYPIHAASGVGYGKDFAGNSHRTVPDGWLSAVRFLVEELGADVNVPDHEGYSALHHAASRGDVELIQYLVDQGADVMAVSRRGQTTADMANGPVQRVEPYPEAIQLLESLGSKNNNKCLSC